MSNNYTNQPEEENFSFDKNKKNPFAMPEGYFDSFANKLKHKIEMEEELKEFTTLNALPKQTAFVVPENYFTQNNIAIKIELVAELTQYKQLAAIEKQNNFSVAPAYFDTVAERVKEVYHSSKKQNGSIVTLIFDFLLKPKIAFAYSFMFIIGTGAFFYLNQEELIESTGDCKTLACLEKRELLNEKNVNEFSDEDLYEMIDIETLDKQISSEENKIDSVEQK